MTLFLFIIQVLTGILLLLYYRPTPNDAFESVQYMMTQVRFGWLIRSVHSWSANLMIFTAFVHMFSVYFLKAYRKPRELTWVSGMLLLFIVMGFGFSGYLLPWNTLAFFATKVGTEMAGSIPVVGKWLLIFLRGGEEVTGATLTRFFGFHVAVLPGLATLLLAIHLLLVQQLGMSVPPGVERAIAEGREPRRIHALLPQFPFARHDRLVRRAGRAGSAGRDLSLGTGNQGRPLRRGPGGNPAGMVFPVYVPNLEIPSRQSALYGRRIAGNIRVLGGGAGLGRRPVSRPANRFRTNDALLYRPGSLRHRVHDGVLLAGPEVKTHENCGCDTPRIDVRAGLGEGGFRQELLHELPFVAGGCASW